MIRSTLKVAGIVYTVAQGQDLGALKEAAVRAAQDGGGLVAFLTRGDRTITALVTPGVPLVIEEVETFADDAGTGYSPEQTDFVDFDS